MNNNDTKVVLILMVVLIGIMGISLLYFSADLSISNSSREIEQAKAELSSLRAASFSRFSGITGGISKAVSMVPMIAVLVMVIALCVGLYSLLVREKKKGRVSFIKSRDAKKIAPDLYAKKKGLERAQKSLLRNRIDELERENLGFSIPPAFAKINSGAERRFPGESEESSEEF